MTLKEYLNTLKVQELKDICKINHIIGISKLKKSALVETMSECELKDTGYNPIINMSDIVPPTILENIQPVCVEEEEEIILHLPLTEDKLKSIRFKKAYERGKIIIDKLK